MKIAVAATPDVAIPTLELIKKSRHTLELIITQPDRPAGRGNSMKQSAVSLWGDKNQISVIKAQSMDEIRAAIKDIDCVVTVAYGVILPIEVLGTPKHGFINLHFSLLPKWRGAAPVQRCLEAGDKQTGVTVFKLDKGMDTGPIYLSKKIDLLGTETSIDLFSQLSVIGADAVLEALTLIEEGFHPTDQDLVGTSHAAKITKDEALINWQRSSAEVDRQIRAFMQSPICWSTFRNEPLRILSAEISDNESIKSGQIAVVDGRVLVGTSDFALILKEVIPSGKRTMSAMEWANGARFTPGEKLG